MLNVYVHVEEFFANFEIPAPVCNCTLSTRHLFRQQSRREAELSEILQP